MIYFGNKYQNMETFINRQFTKSGSPDKEFFKKTMKEEAAIEKGKIFASYYF